MVEGARELQIVVRCILKRPMTSISRCKDVDVHEMLSMDMKALRFDSVLCIIGKLSSAAYCIRINRHLWTCEICP